MTSPIRKTCHLLVCLLALSAGACEDDDGGSPGTTASRDAATPDTAMAGDAAGADAGASPDASSDVAAADAAPAMCPAAPPESECDPPMSEALAAAGGRARQCAFDVGSTNVKVIITSTAAGDRSSLNGERVCKKALRLRDKVVDAMMMPKPLAEADMDALVAQLKKYGDICTGDGGTVLGAVATQWARTATNPDEIKGWFMAKMGLPLNILSGDQEGAYGYAAASHDQPDRIILDAGGGSFQISFWATGDAKPTAISIKFGHDESSAKVWTKADFSQYGPARQAYVDELKKLIAGDAAVSAGLARLKELVAAGKLSGELISLGDSGVILAVEGKLQDDKGHFVDQLTYLQRLDERRRELATVTAMGPKKTLTAEAVNTFLAQLTEKKDWFEELRAECVRKAYGGKVLGHLTLLAHLVSEYGLSPRVVFTSGEMAEGFILERLKTPAMP